MFELKFHELIVLSREHVWHVVRLETCGFDEIIFEYEPVGARREGEHRRVRRLFGPATAAPGEENQRPRERDGRGRDQRR